MSIEIPNKLNSSGVFADPNSFSPFESPILSSQGVEPYDETNSPSNIVGGLTRLAAGAYIVRQVEAIDILEGVAVAQARGTATHVAQAIIVPGAPTNNTAGQADKKAIAINIRDMSDGSAADGPFQMLCFRFTTGPKYSDLPT